MKEVVESFLETTPRGGERAARTKIVGLARVERA
jgi:hypothetical protein